MRRGALRRRGSGRGVRSTRRSLAHALITVGLVGTACIPGTPSGPGEGGAEHASGGSFEQVACSLPRQYLVRLRNGYHPRRSGEITLVLAGDATFDRSHAGPEPRLQRVPLFLYGPGHVPAAGRIDRPVTMVDIAPTLGRHLRFPFDTRDGRPLTEALPLGEEPPKLILVVVWDGGGHNLLRRWDAEWRPVRDLIPEGVWFENHTLGSSPSVTPPTHAILGTGVFPSRHGLVDLFLRDKGEIVSANEHSRYLLVETLADRWDADRANEPVVGAVAYQPWQLGMIGHGSLLPGGDRDVAAILDESTGAWGPPEGSEDLFDFPRYLDHAPDLTEDVRRLDLEDGTLDGRWLGEAILEDPALSWVTPPYVRSQTQVLDELIRREGFGADDVPDLLFTNYKQIDMIGHRWGMEARQMQQAVEATADAFVDLVEILDRRVGAGEWVMALTADHGVTPTPGKVGNFAASRDEVPKDVERRFGDGAIDRYRPTQLWMNEDVLEENGHSVEDVARFLGRYTREQNSPNPADLPEDERGDLVFAAAFPSDVLRQASCRG